MTHFDTRYNDLTDVTNPTGLIHDAKPSEIHSLVALRDAVPWRWNSVTISLNLGGIWEMLV